MSQQNTTSGSGGDPPTSTASGQGQTDPEVQGVLNPNPGNLHSNTSDLARDPVCGNMVEKAGAANTLPASVNERGESTIYFDTPECKALYEADPEKYGSQR
ncbi:MAG: hypothetical protein ACHQ4H_03320 [Ktedonobacterales bacterium]|jgi:YHS domain-containing protein